MEALIHFKEKFNKYSDKKDKFDSLYIFVVNEVVIEELIDKISKIILSLENISDVKRKNYLKNFVDKKAVGIYTNELTNEQILKISYNIKNLEYQKELEDILDKLLDPKVGNKIVFGKDIQISIKNSLLKNLYCTEEIYKKSSVIPEHLKTFELKIIKQIQKGDIYHPKK